MSDVVSTKGTDFVGIIPIPSTSSRSARCVSTTTPPCRARQAGNEPSRGASVQKQGSDAFADDGEADFHLDDGRRIEEDLRTHRLHVEVYRKLLLRVSSPSPSSSSTNGNGGGTNGSSTQGREQRPFVQRIASPQLPHYFSNAPRREKEMPHRRPTYKPLVDQEANHPPRQHGSKMITPTQRKLLLPLSALALFVCLLYVASSGRSKDSQRAWTTEGEGIGGAQEDYYENGGDSLPSHKFLHELGGYHDRELEKGIAGEEGGITDYVKSMVEPYSSRMKGYLGGWLGGGGPGEGGMAGRCPTPWLPPSTTLTSGLSEMYRARAEAEGARSSTGSLGNSTPLATDQLKCINVPSNSTNFDIELCYSTTLCNQGWVNVAYHPSSPTPSNSSYVDKRTCAEIESSLHPAPKDPIEEAYIKNQLGPHTIYVIFDGAIRQAHEKPVGYTMDGSCLYRYRFELNNGGDWWMRVVLVYDDYLGLDAADQKNYQRIVDIPLLAQPFKSPIDSCSSQCQRYVTSDYDKILAVGAPHLRRCEREQEIFGSWTPNYDRLSPMYDVEPPVASLGTFDGAEKPSTNPLVRAQFPPYTWVPHCILDTTAIDAPAPPPPTPSLSIVPTSTSRFAVAQRKSEREIQHHLSEQKMERALCFGHISKILFTGDSHVRALHDGMLRRLQGAFVGQKNGQVSDWDIGNWSRDRAAVGGVYVDYLFDPVLEEMRDNMLIKEEYVQYSHIVLGAAQWLMHQPYREYQAHISNVLRIIAIFTSGHPFNQTNTPYPPPLPPRFLFHTSPAWPHRDDDKVHRENDTRTNARLRQMNDFAAGEFLKAGHTIIETFDVSLPFCQMQESKDLSHFFNSGVLEALYRLTAHRLGLCDP